LAEQHSDRFTEPEEHYAGYEVYDPDGEKIGKVDDLFVDENDNPKYIGVKTGFMGTRPTLIPMNVVRIDERRRVVEVSQSKSKVREGPAFDDDEEITPEYEERVRSHYEPGSDSRPGAPAGDASQRRGSDLDEQDELRIQRSEEELRTGTREREAGRVSVRKRVRTDRERLTVPKRREEVNVERVPVESREAPEAKIGEDELVVPVTEEEVVAEKRPVVKEEIRLRKEVSEDEELVERDVRKEEVDIDDQTERGGRHGHADDR